MKYKKITKYSKDENCTSKLEIEEGVWYMFDEDLQKFLAVLILPLLLDAPNPNPLKEVK